MYLQRIYIIESCVPNLDPSCRPLHPRVIEDDVVEGGGDGAKVSHRLQKDGRDALEYKENKTVALCFCTVFPIILAWKLNPDVPSLLVFVPLNIPVSPVAWVRAKRRRTTERRRARNRDTVKLSCERISIVFACISNKNTWENSR